MEQNPGYNFMYKPSVLVLYYGGKSGDLQDTVNAIKGIGETLIKMKYEYLIQEVNNNNWQEAIKIPGDVVFNFVEDEDWSLYKKVVSGLERLKRVQFGHSKYIIKYLVDKNIVKKRLSECGLHTPKYVYVNKSNTSGMEDLNFPVILKPVGQHAAVGISQKTVFENINKLRKYLIRYTGEYLAEEYIDGREIQVSVFGNKQIIVMPLCEIRYTKKFKKAWKIYSYNAKWNKKSWEYWDARVKSPVKIDKKTERNIINIAKRAFKCFWCVDLARFDFRLNIKNDIFLIDVNYSPSINNYDDQDATTASMRAMKMSYDKFLHNLILMAWDRRK